MYNINSNTCIKINQFKHKFFKITVISLHHISKKISGHVTLLALWNPVLFILNYMTNIETYDGYLSSCSEIIDKFVYAASFQYKPTYGILTTSLPLCLFKDIKSIQDKRLFYIGTNWHKQCSSNNHYAKMRNLTLIKRLDDMTLIDIYGPRKYSNTSSWEGYHNYKGEIQFDGTSVIDKIQCSGVCLVLSSIHHTRSEVCSMRIFEAISAGVPIICDKNPFFTKWFGDDVFYIDNLEHTVDDDIILIKKYLDFIENNEPIVKKMIYNCREIFKKHFSFDVQFKTIINNIRNNSVIELKHYDIDNQ